MTSRIEPDWDHPDINRRLRNRCRTYGLEVEDFRDLWTQQDGRCGICRAELTLREARIDHYHDPDRDLPEHRREYVRGLLCQGCNTTLPRYENATDEEIQQHLTWIEEEVAHAHHRLDTFSRARRLYLRKMTEYLTGTRTEDAEDDYEALITGRRLPWRDTNWASAGFDLDNGLTIEFTEPR